MGNNLQTFVHERFGKVRVVMINGEPWFVAADVCKALGLQNPRKAVAALSDDEKKLAMIPVGGVTTSYTPGSYQNVNVVNEPGMYHLIFASRKPEARDFQHWVYHEVLPSIRKTGSYSLFAPAAEPLADKTAPAAIRPELIYRVYVFLLANGNIKLGRTKRLCTRIDEVKHDTRLPIAGIYFTPFMRFEDARVVEKCCKEIFSTRRITDEIFSVAFTEACAAVEHFVKLVAVKPIDSKLNIATVNLAAAEKST